MMHYLILGLYRIINLPDTGYQPDGEFKIRPDPDTRYRIRIPISESDCVKNRNSLNIHYMAIYEKISKTENTICNNVLNCKFSYY